jgi:hypothetical protein
MAEITSGRTMRGYQQKQFLDSHNTPCSLQVSSAALKNGDRSIWFGPTTGDDSIQVGFPWRDVSIAEMREVFDCAHVGVTDRMHLTQTQVKALLPILQRFVATGHI